MSRSRHRRTEPCACTSAAPAACSSATPRHPPTERRSPPRPSTCSPTATAAPLGIRRDGAHRTFDYVIGRRSASSTAAPETSGRSTDGCSPTSRCSTSARATSWSCASATTPARCIRCTCTVTTSSCCPAMASRHPAARGGSIRSTCTRRVVRDRLRRRQPGDLERPLPHPPACGGRAGRPPHVRGRVDTVHHQRRRGNRPE